MMDNSMGYLCLKEACEMIAAIILIHTRIKQETGK